MGFSGLYLRHKRKILAPYDLRNPQTSHRRVSSDWSRGSRQHNNSLLQSALCFLCMDWPCLQYSHHLLDTASSTPQSPAAPPLWAYPSCRESFEGSTLSSFNLHMGRLSHVLCALPRSTFLCASILGPLVGVLGGHVGDRYDLLL